MLEGNKFYYLCTQKQMSIYTYARVLLAHNYTNLMPHSPLLIANLVHIFILALNEGAATGLILDKREV